MMLTQYLLGYAYRKTCCHPALAYRPAGPVDAVGVNLLWDSILTTVAVIGEIA
jgi:hypothetical protein